MEQCSFLLRKVHTPLLATFRAEAQNLLRLSQGGRISATSIQDNLRGIDVLLNVLQGILLVGLRDILEHKGNEGMNRDVEAALQESWFVEVSSDGIP